MPVQEAPGADPTRRTIETLHREITTMQERSGLELKGVKDNTTEQFRSIAKQMELVEKQRVEQKEDTKVSVDAALTAQKEAVKEQTTASERAIAKSETATNKQMDQMTATFTASIQGVTDLLNDTKERVGKIEAKTQGGNEVRQEHQANSVTLIAIASLVATLVSGALTAMLIKAFGG